MAGIMPAQLRRGALWTARAGSGIGVLIFFRAFCNQGGRRWGSLGVAAHGAGQLSPVSRDRLRRIMGTMPALMGSSRSARQSLFLPPGPRAAKIKRKRRERRFDFNTKQIIPPGMEQNKSEWSLMAVIPPRQATAGGSGACRSRDARRGRYSGGGGHRATWAGRLEPRVSGPRARARARGGPNTVSQAPSCWSRS